jgi:hypothetical protein
LIIGPLNSTNHVFRKLLKPARPALKSSSAREASIPPLKISITQQLVPCCGISNISLLLFFAQFYNKINFNYIFVNEIFDNFQRDKKTISKKKYYIDYIRYFVDVCKIL